jgi:type IV pilus assembly protein PilY1
MGGAQLSVTNQYAYKTSYERASGATSRSTRSTSAPACCRSTPTAIPPTAAVVGGDPARRAGGRERLGERLGHAAPHRDDQRRDRSRCAVPARQPLGRAAVVADRRLEHRGGAADAQQVLNYLRGDKSNEGINTASFRTRSHILGDIVYSGAVPVGAPSGPYADTGAAGSPNPGYNAFKSAKALRTPMVYVGGNDGMMHAFVDNAANGGKEAWAYVPKVAVRRRRPQRHRPHAFGRIPDRSARVPARRHSALLAQVLRERDRARLGRRLRVHEHRDAAATATTGGRCSSAGSAPAAAPSTRWTSRIRSRRRRRSCRPTPKRRRRRKCCGSSPMRTSATSTTRPRSSRRRLRLGHPRRVGLQQSGRQGYLYVLNPNAPTRAGQLLKKIRLPNDTGTDTIRPISRPIRAFTASRQNPYVLQAYGGDIKGNVWRFDLSSSDASQWKAEKIATLKDATGKASPSRPACASRSTRTTASTATSSSGPASCSTSRTSSTRR